MQTTTTRNTVVGVFEDRRHAQQAIDELKQAGFRDDQIGVVTRDEHTEGETIGEEGSYAATGAVAGAATGAGVGALWAVGIAAGMLPAIGPVIAGGLLASLLASAGVGAAVGGLAGALIGMGIPEEEAHYYEDEFKAGRTIVTVKADGRSNEAASILQRFGAYDASTRGEAATHTGEDTRTVQLREEELRARKQQVEAGEVRVHKDVHTEHKTIDVPVTKEEVVVERHPVGEHRAAGTPIREGEDIRIPVREEQVTVEKQPVVTEEVQVGKRKVHGTEQVSGTVRKEDVRVETEGNVDVDRNRR